MVDQQDPRLTKLIERMTGSRPRAAGTLTGYLASSKRFIEWLKDKPMERATVDRYFAWRRQSKVKESTLLTEFAHLRALFEANDLTWPFHKNDSPVPNDPHQPVLTEDEIKRLILFQGFNHAERFYLALSTTWGPRVGEMARLHKINYDHEKITLQIEKQKKVVKRTHLIPDEIKSVFTAYHFNEHGGAGLMFMFRRMCQKAGIEREAREGFHAVRRFLDTYFKYAVVQFRGDNMSAYPLWAESCGWSKGKQGINFAGSAMAGRYAHDEVLSQDPFWIDRLLYSVHPFLKVWSLAPVPTNVTSVITLPVKTDVKVVREYSTIDPKPCLSPLDEAINRIKELGL